MTKTNQLRNDGYHVTSLVRTISFDSQTGEVAGLFVSECLEPLFLSHDLVFFGKNTRQGELASLLERKDDHPVPIYLKPSSGKHYKRFVRRGTAVVASYYKTEHPIHFVHLTPEHMSRNGCKHKGRQHIVTLRWITREVLPRVSPSSAPLSPLAP